MIWPLVHKVIDLVIIHKDDIKAVGEGFEGLGLVSGLFAKAKENTAKTWEAIQTKRKAESQTLHVVLQPSEAHKFQQSLDNVEDYSAQSRA